MQRSTRASDLFSPTKNNMKNSNLTFTVHVPIEDYTMHRNPVSLFAGPAKISRPPGDFLHGGTTPLPIQTEPSWYVVLHLPKAPIPITMCFPTVVLGNRTTRSAIIAGATQHWSTPGLLQWQLSQAPDLVLWSAIISKTRVSSLGLFTSLKRRESSKRHKDVCLWKDGGDLFWARYIISERCH